MSGASKWLRAEISVKSQAYLNLPCGFFLPIAQFSGVCLNVKFSPHLQINALEMCMFFPVALRTRKTFTPLEKHKTRKKRGPSIPCRRPSFWVPILDQPLLPWLALRTSSWRRGVSLPNFTGGPTSALLGTLNSTPCVLHLSPVLLLYLALPFFSVLIPKMHAFLHFLPSFQLAALFAIFFMHTLRYYSPLAFNTKFNGSKQNTCSE